MTNYTINPINESTKTPGKQKDSTSYYALLWWGWLRV